MVGFIKVGIVVLVGFYASAENAIYLRGRYIALPRSRFGL